MKNTLDKIADGLLIGAVGIAIVYLVLICGELFAAFWAYIFK